jgi:hypothetical protein
MRKILMLASITVIALLILTSTVSAIGLDIFSSAADSAPDDSLPAEEPELSVEADSTSDGLVPTTEKPKESESTSSSSNMVPPANKPPVAKFTYAADPDPPSVNVIIEFDASDSYDPDGEIAYHDWYYIYPNNTGLWYEIAFGCKSPMLNYTFDEPGTYIVILAVVDDDGANEAWISFFNQTIEVVPNYPPVGICDVRPANVRLNRNLVLDGSASYDPDGRIIRYDWFFMPSKFPGGWYDIGSGGKQYMVMTNFSFSNCPDNRNTTWFEIVKEHTGEYVYEYIIILAVVDNNHETHVWTSYGNHSVNITTGLSLTSESNIESQDTQQLENQETTQETSSQSESNRQSLISISQSTQYGWFNTIMRQIQNRVNLTN